MAGCDEDRNIVRVRGKGCFQPVGGELLSMMVNVDPKPHVISTGFYGNQLCIVMHCCAIGATGAPVNAN